MLGKKSQEGKGIKKQSQILVWPLPFSLSLEISHGQHGRWHRGLSIHHHQEGGSCCQQLLFPGWDLSWMEKVSLLAVSDLQDMALHHPHISILHLCQEPIPSLVCPQPKTKVGATSKEETEVWVGLEEDGQHWRPE